MDKKDHILEEPRGAYGGTIKLSEVTPTPMHNMLETLREQGYISHEEFIERLSKHL